MDKHNADSLPHHHTVSPSDDTDKRFFLYSSLVSLTSAPLAEFKDRRVVRIGIGFDKSVGHLSDAGDTSHDDGDAFHVSMIVVVFVVVWHE